MLKYRWTKCAVTRFLVGENRSVKETLEMTRSCQPVTIDKSDR